MTLRRTLVAVQVAVVAVGLAVFGVASYVLYQGSLQRAEQGKLLAQVQPLRDELCQAVGACRPSGTPAHGTPAGGASHSAYASSCGSTLHGRYIIPIPGSFAELRAPSGAVLAVLRVPYAGPETGGARCPRPALPRDLPTGRFRSVTSANTAPGPFLVYAANASVGGTGPDGGSPDATGPGSTPLAHDVVVVAIPTTSVTTSLRNLRILELAVGAVLLLVLGAVTLLVVRRSLQPLERMVGTARAISGGDLSRRVPAGDDRTEIGQLGHALNHMLASIEQAFAQREATEHRLRQFLADASHELRTPLTSIRGYAELWRLSGGRVTAPGDHDEPVIDATTAMDRVEHHARRMSDLVEELLLLARLDEARPTERRPVDLAALAAEACDDIAAVDPQRAVSLDAPDAVVVEGDPAHLRRALGNLTANALRHTPAGGAIAVRVTAEGPEASVVVRDHGPGLPPEGLLHAFDRFWQADASRGAGGTGLGLSIVAAIAAEHGGSATVANAADGGAVFTLTLPIPRRGSLPPPTPERDGRGRDGGRRSAAGRFA